MNKKNIYFLASVARECCTVEHTLYKGFDYLSESRKGWEKLLFKAGKKTL